MKFFHSFLFVAVLQAGLRYAIGVKMKNLKQLSITFMKQSKILSLSCISSIFMAVILIVGMCNFSLNVKNSYNQSLRAAYGDCDILGDYEDYGDITQTIIDSISNINDVKEVASGRFLLQIMN